MNSLSCDSRGNAVESLPFSVVVPVHNEQEAIEELLFEIELVMDNTHAEYEIVVVNDGSSDRTGDILDGLKCKLHARMLILSSESSVGQSGALLSGFRAARGEVLITLDGDGQNDPRDIPKLLSLLSDSDMAVGTRNHRRDRWSKRLFSKVANWLRNQLTHSTVPDSGCGLKVFHRGCLNSLIPFCAFHRFFTVLVELHGGHVTSTPVAHRPRNGGRTHYGILDRLIPSLLDGLAIAWLMRRRISNVDAHTELQGTSPSMERPKC